MDPKDMKQVDEAMMDVQANMYQDKYTDQVDAYLEKSSMAKINESITAQEVVALGQQLDQYSRYASHCESQGNLSALGTIPMVALDVITAAVGGSILPLVCSIQPIQEEHSVVYYKQIKASQTAGGYNKGDVISDPLTRDNLADGNLGGQRKTTSVGTGDGTDTNFVVNLPAPTRSYTIEIFAGTGVFGKDDGKGNIMGVGCEGTINYETGALDVTFTSAPANAVAIVAISDVDIDSAAALDKIEGSLITKDIRAELWALAADVGTIANFSFQNRFGRSATDEVAADLSNELTRILNTQAILRIRDAAVGNTNWNETPANAISYAEHKLTFVDAIADTESVLHQNSGANSINRIICGRTAAAKLRGMAEFTSAAAPSTTSVGLYGSYDGIPVIRATGIIADNEIICLSNPDGYFNAPLAYSPFMPLIITDTVQSPSNPFRNTKAAAVWAGMTNLNSNLSTKLTITTS